MKPTIGADLLIHLVTDTLGQAVARWQPAPYGADHVVLLAALADGRRVVIKAGPEAHIDAYVLRRLASLPVAVPEILAETTIEADGSHYPVIVMTHISGVLLAEVPQLTPGIVQSLLDQIRAVHSIRGYDGAGPMTEVLVGRGRGWKDYLLHVLSGQNLDFEWRRIRDDARVDADALDLGIHWLRQRLTYLPDRELPRLLHGDLNPVNIFVDGGSVVGIVDWSYARFGDPLFDFARWRMNSVIRNDPSALRDYFDLLQLDRVSADRERVYYVFNLVEYVNWYYLEDELDLVRTHLRLIASEIHR